MLMLSVISCQLFIDIDHLMGTVAEWMIKESLNVTVFGFLAIIFNLAAKQFLINLRQLHLDPFQHSFQGFRKATFFVSFFPSFLFAMFTFNYIIRSLHCLHNVHHDLKVYVGLFLRERKKGKRRKTKVK